MKNFLLIFIILFFSNLFSQEKTEKSALPLKGKYEVVSGSSINTFDVSDEVILAIENGTVVEKFIFWGKEEDFFVLEKVAVDFDLSKKNESRDRMLLQVKLEKTLPEIFMLTIYFPYGAIQEIKLKKA